MPSRRYLPANCNEEQEKQWDGALCPRFHYAIELIGKRWTGAIIRILISGPKRFYDIRNTIPLVSDRMLSERLKELELAGILERHVYPETPVRIEYLITSKGMALAPVMDAVNVWASRHVDDDELAAFTT